MSDYPTQRDLDEEEAYYQAVTREWAEDLYRKMDAEDVAAMNPDGVDATLSGDALVSDAPASDDDTAGATFSDGWVNGARPKLGDWLEVSAKAHKTHPDDPDVTIWVTDPCVPFRAMFIGYRTGYNGRWTIENDHWSYALEDVIEGERYFAPNSHFEVWLFIDNARRNHFYAFPADCTSVTSTVSR